MPFSSLYVHVPFCRSKCRYCAFYSLPAASWSTSLIEDYLMRLEQELQCAAHDCQPLNSIYIGGGTPSLLTDKQLTSLFELLWRYMTPGAACEFTVECNPQSLSPQKLQCMLAHGVNRISLGVQSFSARLRQILGRDSADLDIRRALDLLAGAKIDNFGVDLIYGIPEQSLDDWRNDIQTVGQSGATHISAYSLTLEEQTALAADHVNLPDDRLNVQMWNAAEDMAINYGLKRYEVSNLAVPGCECRHNLAIWQGAAYIGCGPGAASFDGRVRWCQPADIKAWLTHEAPLLDELPTVARAAEILAFGLRTSRGWNLDEFYARTGCDAMKIRGEVLLKLCDEGLLSLQKNCLVPTRKGLLFADYAATEILI